MPAVAAGALAAGAAVAATPDTARADLIGGLVRKMARELYEGRVPRLPGGLPLAPEEVQRIAANPTVPERLYLRNLAGVGGVHTETPPEFLDELRRVATNKGLRIEQTATGGLQFPSADEFTPTTMVGADVQQPLLGGGPENVPALADLLPAVRAALEKGQLYAHEMEFSSYNRPDIYKSLGSRFFSYTDPVGRPHIADLYAFYDVDPQNKHNWVTGEKRAHAPMALREAKVTLSNPNFIEAGQGNVWKGLENLGFRYGKPFAINWPLAAAAVANTAGQFLGGAKAAVGLDDETIRRAVIDASKRPGGYTALGAAESWLAQQAQPLAEPNALNDAIVAGTNAFMKNPRQSLAAVGNAIKQNPAGAAGFTAATILPMRPPQFFRGTRLPAVLSHPAALARETKSAEEFQAMLNAPLHAITTLLRRVPPGQIGTVKDFIGNPDLVAHLPWGVADMPVIKGGTLAAGALSGEMMTGSIRLHPDIFDPAASRSGAPASFPHAVSNTPEDLYRNIFGEELLHAIRGATPGTVSAREVALAPELKVAATPGRKFKVSKQAMPAAEYYGPGNPAENAAARALGFFPQPGRKVPEFKDFLLPTEQTFQRYGYSGAADFWEKMNSPEYAANPFMSLRGSRRLVKRAAAQAAAPQPQIVTELRGQPPGMKFIDWWRHVGKP